MNVHRAVLAFASAMILASLLLAWAVSPYWMLLTLFVGLNMMQAPSPASAQRARYFASSGWRLAVPSQTDGN
jgi:hypothetical protein